MKLKLYNTPTKQLQDFIPINNNEVLIYSCGPTVYNDLHIGNWSAYIYWDILVRVLIADGYKPKQIINITDVGHLTDDADDGDDKLEVSSKKENTTAWEIANKYTENYLKGREDLGLLPPHKFIKATDYITEQLDLIKTLKEKGYIYQISDGLYFDTEKFPAYAEFAHLNLDNQRTSERICLNEEKKSQSDFAVWKFSPKNKQRAMEWSTPSSLLDDGSEKKGFPGWHIECSAIILNELGNTIDIHTGGIDHIPIHHTNEIAQSVSATGSKLANFWLHNNHMKIDGTKISKSLQNGYTLADITKKGFTTDDFRMFVLQSHFQNETNFTFANLEAAANRLLNWRNYATIRHQSYTTVNQNQEKLTFLPESKLLLEILNDNLNTPKALTFIDSVFSKIDNTEKIIDRESFTEFLETIDSLLGFNLIESTPDINDETKQLIIKRRNARDNQDWERSDELRNELTKKGIALRDTQKHSYWHYLK